MSKQEIIDIEPSAPAGALATPTAAPLAGRAAATDAMVLISEAISRNVSAESLALLVDLKHKMEDRTAKQAYTAALVAFRSEAPAIVKGSVVDFSSTKGGRVHYNFASLDDIESAIAPFLAKHKLAYTFPKVVPNVGGFIKIVCRISHAMGHSEDSETDVKSPTEMRGMNEAQLSGSAISFARRYSLCLSLGLRIVGEDNDTRDFSPTTEAFEDATKPITIEQANELNTLGSELKIDKAQWLKRASENIGRPVREWIDLPQSEYLKVRSAMMTKKQSAKA